MGERIYAEDLGSEEPPGVENVAQDRGCHRTSSELPSAHAVYLIHLIVPQYGFVDWHPPYVDLLHIARCNN